MKKTHNPHPTLQIGFACIFAYVVSYVVRNALSVCSPGLLQTPGFTKEYVGLLSSVYLIFYATGQLFSGMLGDCFKPKYMLSSGLALSGACLLLFTAVQQPVLHFCCFALVGAGLSMLRGPITKLLAENAQPQTASWLCTLLNAASFIGPMAAAALSLLFYHKTVFAIAGAISIFTALGLLLFLNRLEKAGRLTFHRAKKPGIFQLADIVKLRGFAVYAALSALGEIINTSVSFWIPTYVTERLCLSSTQASAIYTLVSCIGLLSPFLALVIYQRLLRNDVLLIAAMYFLSTIFLQGTCLLADPAANLCFLLLAKLTAGCANGIIWSVYVPGLARSGLVSGANGLMDCLGYALASIANAAFALIAGRLGWLALTESWSLVCLLSAAIAFLYLKSSSGNKAEPA